MLRLAQGMSLARHVQTLNEIHASLVYAGKKGRRLCLRDIASSTQVCYCTTSAKHLLILKCIKSADKSSST